ncbi:unnamed protein product [Amoebophrya sp. A25]|nr:unnamed protein product [Amoebophrya sp. A25]|eukprot:GSA25T00023284001.1
MAAANGSPTANGGSSPHGETDQRFLDKFSRQNAALGAETTLKLTKLRVLIVGAGNGLGIETAKNIVLQGCGGVTLFDATAVTKRDLGVNFFLTEADVGKVKHDVLVPKLKELNPLCKVVAGSGSALSEDLVLQHAVVVVTDPKMSGQDLAKWNEFCRSKRISFLYGRSQGVFCTIFSDHGPNHMVSDRNGENPLVRIVEHIEKGESEPLVRYSVPEGTAPATFTEGAYIEFSPDIQGLKGIAENQVTLPTGEKIVGWRTTTKSKDPQNTLRLVGSTAGFPGDYLKGGTLTEKKVAEPSPCASFAEKLAQPGTPFVDMVGTDMLDFGSELQIHLAMAVQLDAGGSLDTAACLAKAKELLQTKKLDLEIDINEDLQKEYAAQAGIELQPMSAFLGGVLGQEVIKVTGKFTPIPGFLHFHCREALPKDWKAGNTSASALQENRYGDLVALYGQDFVTKLQNQKLFMVGCGALGCELLKNFALNGICCGPSGKLTVTDADRIELSNLARQFLFREHNVGHAKSVAAGAMAKTMNKDLKISAKEMFVGKSTEDTFDDAFWMELDAVVNALDNMEARFYVDGQCVKYEKPLLESGTMGPSGNVDPIVPFKTKTYRDGGEAAAGGGIPMCTLRNFPHLPDHCIEWARDLFEFILVKTPKQLEKLLADPEGFLLEKTDTTDVGQSLFELRVIGSLLQAGKKPSVTAAAQVAYDLFHFLFRDKITDLVTAFPENARTIDPDTKQDKGPFWTGHKRFPKVAKFEPGNTTHAEFMIACTNLVAVTIGANPVKQDGDDSWLANQRSAAWLNSLLPSLKTPEYISGGIKLDDNDPNNEKLKKDANSGRIALEKIAADIKAEVATPSGGKLLPNGDLLEADFEKDDDFNFHIALITHLSNLRADNYFIQNSDFQKVKLVAGRIIPAIATTTAAVTGLVIMELFKVLLDKPCEALRQRLVGLATNTYTSFEADEPKKLKSGEQVEKPDVSTLKDDAFDENGKVKEEYFLREKYAAYPNPHTVWDKLTVSSGDMSLKGFIDWLENEHNICLTNWAFILGHKKGGEDGKDKMPVSTTVYPFAVSLDNSLMPPLDSDNQTAMSEIMKSTKIPQAHKMKYMNEWRSAKQTGKFAEPIPEELRISNETSLRQILKIMASKAELGLKEGKIDAKFGATVTHTQLEQAKFWLIPADETPSCETNPTYVDGDDEPLDVKFLAAIKIPLVDLAELRQSMAKASGDSGCGAEPVSGISDGKKRDCCF